MTQQFTITPEEQIKLDAWLKDQYAAVAKAQIGSDAEKWHFTMEDGSVYPYFGAIGGELTFQFTNTSIGTVTKVIFCKGSKYEAVLDLTDYDSW